MTSTFQDSLRKGRSLDVCRTCGYCADCEEVFARPGLCDFIFVVGDFPRLQILHDLENLVDMMGLSALRPGTDDAGCSHAPTGSQLSQHPRHGADADRNSRLLPQSSHQQFPCPAGPRPAIVFGRCRQKFSQGFEQIRIDFWATIAAAPVRLLRSVPSKRRLTNRRIYKFSALLSYIIIILFFCLARPSVGVLYGAQYAEASPILMIHLWALLFVSLGVARGQWLVAAGLLKFSLFATVLGAAANIFLNFLLIPLYGGSGAAVATVISYGISGFLSSFLIAATSRQGLLQLQAIFVPFSLATWKEL